MFDFGGIKLYCIKYRIMYITSVKCENRNVHLRKKTLNCCKTCIFSACVYISCVYLNFLKVSLVLVSYYSVVVFTKVFFQKIKKI